MGPFISFGMSPRLRRLHQTIGIVRASLSLFIQAYSPAPLLFASGRFFIRYGFAIYPHLANSQLLAMKQKQPELIPVRAAFLALNS